MLQVLFGHRYCRSCLLALTLTIQADVEVHLKGRYGRELHELRRRKLSELITTILMTDGNHKAIALWCFQGLLPLCQCCCTKASVRMISQFNLKIPCHTILLCHGYKATHACSTTSAF